jgi:tRNA (guanine26-N2/guanine27-N2)-dimethyltransferase
LSLKGFVPYKEGLTTLLVPKQSLGKGPPELFPAFFNPRGKAVRDISVLAFESFAGSLTSPAVLADPLSGVGGRSIRIANECQGISMVRANDLNPVAIQAARLSATTNGCEGRVSLTTLDANLFLAQLSSPEGRPTIVDIDPFGTPAPFVESALRALADGGLLAVTATDTAVLSGLYPDVAFRKYGAMALRTDYGRESMLRILMGFVARRALVYDMAVEALLCHSDQHYVRVYCRVEISPSKANDSLDKIGYLLHCFKCDHREASAIPKESCSVCGGKVRAAGPLWLGDLHEAAFLDSLAAQATSTGMKRYLPLFVRAREELGFPPFYYKIPFFTDKLGVASVSPTALVERLVSVGFRSARSSVDSQGVKSFASVKDVLSALANDQPLKPRPTK